MSFFRFVVVTMTMQFCVWQPSECNHTNISCVDIRAKHPPGFTFLYRCTGTEVFAYYNLTVVAHAKPLKRYYNWSWAEVISMDNSSIVTTKCRNLRIQCILYNGQYYEETWEEFEVAETSPVANEVTLQRDLKIALSLSSVILIIGMLFCYYKRNAIMSRFAGSLQSCCCHRDGGCQFRCHEDDAGQNSTNADVETPHDVSLEVIFTPEPRGSGGNEQENAGTVQAHGNLTVDPGGASAVRTMNLNNGCTHGDRGPERQPLLDQRAAVHIPDMTAEAVALVNEHDLDPDRVSTCRTAQDNDVESNPR